MTVRPRRQRAGVTTVLALAAALALLAATANAQSNMCYPKLNTRSRLKKGPCFMVSHTLPDFLDRDMPGALNPLSNNFILVDRSTGEPVGPTCVRTKVYVSTDATATDLGDFKREAWATQAMTLVEGQLQVDFAAIETNLAVTKRTHKAAKHNSTTQLDTIFMVEFECPSVGTGKWRDNKLARHSIFRAALRYIPPPPTLLGGLMDSTNSNLDNVYNLGSFMGDFMGLLSDSHGKYDSSGPYSYAPTPVAGAALDAGPSNQPPSMDWIHSPLCDALDSLETETICEWFGPAQSFAFNRGPAFVKGTSCQGNYPSFIQGSVDQSWQLTTDVDGNRLPGTFANLLQQNSGHLPEQVAWNTILAEKATLFWLYDKIQQLGAWTFCDNGQVPYAFANALAQGFSAPTYYRITNSYEFPRSVNLTNPVLSLSATGLDGANKNTFLLVTRGSIARSEWIADLQYNQLSVNNALLATRPLLAPFKGMKIHSGFAGLFEQIYPGIKASVTAALPSLDRILATGHSLGGGVTQFLALALATDFPGIPVDAALFAPPAVGNYVFAEAFNTNVNGRRVAYVAQDPPTEFPLTSLLDIFLVGSFGDPVPQVPCPNQPVCRFNNLITPVPVSTKTGLSNRIAYQAVDGNVLFTYRHLPDGPSYPGLESNAIRETWKQLKGYLNAGNAHRCSYACFMSDRVNVDLTQCFIQPTGSNWAARVNGETLTQVKNKLPANVQMYGMC